LRRVAPGASYREEMSQLLLPITDGAPAAEVVRRVIEELLPVGDSDTTAVTL
jgi:hypothetical protein